MEAILLMGGVGDRFGSSIPKQFHELWGKKIYLHTLERLMESNLFNEIVIVCCAEWMETVKAEAKDARIVCGGPTRQESSLLGLLSCKTEHVLIHDAVRPFVNQRILKDHVEAVKRHKAVDTCIPSFDTIVHSKDGKMIDAIPLRSEYLRGQTPQTFAYELILEAHHKTTKRNASDDCSLVLELGHPIYIVEGEEKNFKITTEKDLMVAKNDIRSQHTQQDPHGFGNNELEAREISLQHVACDQE